MGTISFFAGNQANYRALTNDQITHNFKGTKISYQRGQIRCSIIEVDPEDFFAKRLRAFIIRKALSLFLG